MTVRATWNGALLAESDRTVVVEGNHYFPPGDVRHEHLEPSSTRTHCPWKGEASYRTVVVDGRRNEDATWYYPDPKEAAAEIAGRIAFWKGVVVSDDAGEPDPADQPAPADRRRAMSKQAMAPAVATLSEASDPCWGMDASASQRFRVSAARPDPSDPSTSATGSSPRGSS